MVTRKGSRKVTRQLFRTDPPASSVSQYPIDGGQLFLRAIHGVRDHPRRLLETEFAVSVFVCFHDSFVHDLLQLRVLPPKIVSLDTIVGFLYGGERTLRLLPTIIFNTKNSSPLEM